MPEARVAEPKWGESLQAWVFLPRARRRDREIRCEYFSAKALSASVAGAVAGRRDAFTHKANRPSLPLAAAGVPRKQNFTDKQVLPSSISET